ncbi:MAG: sulfatase-like hydrolase/transferase, partial [Clostridia bacterium]
LNTGRSLFAIERQGQEIPAEHALLGEVLKENGYETFGSGKWHNGKTAFNRSFTDGDSIFFGGMHDHWNVPLNHYDPTAKYESKTKKIFDFRNENKPAEYIADHVRSGEHSTDIIAQTIIDFLDRKHDKPFYAYASFLAPHDPRTMPQEFRDMYDEEKIKIPPNFMSYHPIEYGHTYGRDEILAPYPRTIQDTKRQLSEYFAMITHIDYQVGRILDKLEEIGEKDNTIIIYAADNGLALGQHGMFGKQNLYEHSVRVPLIFSGKGIEKNVKTDSLVYLYDIFPTLCDILEIKKPDSVLGQSFANVLADNSEKARECLYLSYIDKIRAVTKNGYKYMEHRHEGLHTCQLFNVEKDPYETMNLYYDENSQDILKDLQLELATQADTIYEKNNEFGKTYWNSVAEVN